MLNVGELPIHGVIQGLSCIQESLLRSVASNFQDLDSLVHVADADLVHRLEYLVGLGVLGHLLHHGGQGVSHESQLLDEARIESVKAQVVLVVVAAVSTSSTETREVLVGEVKAWKFVVAEVHGGDVVEVEARDVVVVEAELGGPLSWAESHHVWEVSGLLGREEREQTKNNEELHGVVSFQSFLD